MKILLAYDILHVYLCQPEVKNEITYLIELLQEMNVSLYVEANSNLMLYLDGLLSNIKRRVVKGSFLLPMRNKETISDSDKDSLIEYAEKLEKNVPPYIYQPDNWKNERLQLLLVLGYYSSINYLKDKQVDLIISNDINLHLEGYKKNLNSKIYRAEQFLERARIDFPEFCIPGKVEITKVPFDNLDVNHSFFDSYRDEYIEFNDWFLKKSNEKAPAYIATIKGRLVGFLVLKEENINEDYSEIVPNFLPCKRLKISSFKVSVNGYRISELFLNIIFKTALDRKVDEIYVTVHTTFENRRVLIELLCSQWGFKKWGFKGIKENVLVRPFKKQLGNLIRSSFPFHYRPILSMIVDINEKQVYDYQKGYLRQIYISHNEECKKLHPEDVILFRNAYSSNFVFIGEVENVCSGFTDRETFIAACKKRSHETEESLNKYWSKETDSLYLIKILHSYDLSDLDGYLIEKRRNELQVTCNSVISSHIFNQLIEGTSYEKNIIIN